MPRHSYRNLPLEELIQEVEKHRLLYDKGDPEYKNILKKAHAWKDIGRKFNQDPEAIKVKWKNCRDAYLKHKRILKGDTSQSVLTYKAWPWTKYMKFLDHVLLVRATKLNDRSASDTVANNGETPSEQGSACEDSSSLGSLSLESQKQSPGDCAENILLPSTSTQMKPPSKRIRKNRKLDHCLVSYLENKQKSEDKYDEVDHLFQSYAKTFKRFTVRSQAKLKVQLAQLFAETELAEFEEQHPPQSTSSLSATNSASAGLAEQSPANDVKSISISMTEF